MKNIYLFDWGDTLMIDFPDMTGKMCDWDHVETMTYAKEALRYISQKARIYIATAAEQSFPEDIEKAFRRTGLHRYIDGYFCKHNTGYIKPAPEFYRAILKQLCAAPDVVTMVGDSLEKDILPAHRLGFKTIWITTPPYPDVPEGVRIISTLRELYPS